MRQRLRGWWFRLTMRRAWRAMGPGEQIGVMMAVLEHNPELRKQFRRTLRVRGAEDDGGRIVMPGRH